MGQLEVLGKSTANTTAGERMAGKQWAERGDGRVEGCRKLDSYLRSEELDVYS